jgi:type 1 fimbria pilin
MEGSSMRVPRSLVLVSCFLLSVLGASTAQAGGGGTIEGGTIRFVGAIVEPTCNLTAVMDAQAGGASPIHSSLQQNCSDTSSASTAANASRPYSVDVTPISVSETDQVLVYFANYVRAANPGSANPVLVTQTYD